MGVGAGSLVSNILGMRLILGGGISDSILLVGTCMLSRIMGASEDSAASVAVCPGFGPGDRDMHI
eukprot:15327161-Alexandrium_andersonii.AAC.1